MPHNLLSLFKGSPFMLAILALLFVSLNGCAAVVGSGATIGIAASQERGIKGKAKDLRREALVLERFLNAGLKLTTAIGVEVYKGRVLLTGATTNTKIADEAIKLVWQIDGVREVINEIQIDRGFTLTDFAHDMWITTQLKSKLGKS